jgi:hypothetical protein
MTTTDTALLLPAIDGAHFERVPAGDGAMTENVGRGGAGAGAAQSG